ncbi:hypothetical protein FRC03_001785 [Tulasnella sp. 419]|nr:hypothetical protein FRC03_001785 [Tulasnella sp. 419]
MLTALDDITPHGTKHSETDRAASVVNHMHRDRLTVLPSIIYVRLGFPNLTSTFDSGPGPLLPRHESFRHSRKSFSALRHARSLTRQKPAPRKEPTPFIEKFVAIFDFWPIIYPESVLTSSSQHAWRCRKNLPRNKILNTGANEGFYNPII